MNRRTYLALIGSGALVGGTLAGNKLTSDSSSETASNIAEPKLETTSEGGPPDPENWNLILDESFEANSLNQNYWDIGWGWGQNTSTSPTQISPTNVSVQDNSLRLRGTHDNGGIISGGVNTKNKLTFGPGSYLEAKIKFARREGFQNAFWAKPNSENWPPELDVVEIFQDGNERSATHVSRHNLHYSTSKKPNDRSSYQNKNLQYELDENLTKSYNTYGVEWQTDSIVHYVNGRAVGEWTNRTLLKSIQIGAPFYMMFSLNINNIGTANRNEPWGEEMVIDWVRLWGDTPASGDEYDDTHYFWLRPAGQSPVNFTFEASGNIRLDSNSEETDYWVSDRNRVATGTANQANSHPGFWFDGEIIDFAYDAPVDTFVDNNLVDPDTLKRPAEESLQV